MNNNYIDVFVCLSDDSQSSRLVLVKNGSWQVMFVARSDADNCLPVDCVK